jgi:hypothetical protein
MANESVWSTIQKMAADTEKSVAEVCAAEPQLYRKYLDEQRIQVVGPLVPIEKRSIAGPEGDCAESRLLLEWH